MKDHFVQRDFPAEEYQAHSKRAIELMEEMGLDALMVTGDFTSSLNYRYLSGHLPRDYQSNFSRPHVMILPKNGEPILIVYVLTERDAQLASWVKDIRSYTQPFSFETVRQALLDLGLQKSKIGVELGVEHRMAVPYGEFDKLRKAFPEGSFDDAADLLWSMRMIKSPREIQCIQKADEINIGALEYCFSQLREGDTEIDAAKHILNHMVEHGAYRPPVAQIIVNSGPEWRTGFFPPKEKTLKKGDLIFIDSGCIINGYWGEFNRMASVGPASDRQKRNHKSILTIIQNTIREGIKPGVKSSDLMKFFISQYKNMGLDPPSYYGEYPFMHLCHGVGLQGSEPPFIRIDSELELKAGMVLSVEAYHKDQEVYGSEEDILITENGCKVLSRMDEELYTIS
ncbi:MAG: aminopeptidase P family protein [Thaumarchaeota archaeon]|nr:aminopeptidase P family protein [Nitrososphaerota archaeon]